MLEEILALSWGTIFWFAIKAVSAWCLATFAIIAAVAIPCAIIAGIFHAIVGD